VLADTTAGALTAEFARTMFVSSPVVVVAADKRTVLAQAERDARTAHAPLLLSTRVTAQLAAAIKALHPRAVQVADLPVKSLAARLPGIRVVSRPTGLPVTAPPAPLKRVAVLIHGPVPAVSSAAVAATAQVAGAAVVYVHGWDPRADPAAIEALARIRPASVVGVGTNFGPAMRLKSRVGVAETGRQLPGGGEVLFPGHRLVALYGHPGTPSLGALGEQDLPASIALAKHMAAEYRPLSRVPVVPTFEIIATVAQASPGPDFLLRITVVVAAALGPGGHGGGNVRGARPAAGTGQPAVTGGAVPAAAQAAECRAGDRPGVETAAGPGAA
jgi:hypothetical protein